LANRAPKDLIGAESRRVFDLGASAGLFVGVSCFEDEGLSSVPFAVDDAVDLAHLFALELGLILPERTVLLLAGAPQKPESIERLAQLVERGARRRSARMSDFYRYTEELTRNTEEAGFFVLTAATHGVSDQGGDFLLATDSLRNRILRTGVAVAEVFDEVTRAGAGRRLVLLDTCRERLSQGTRGVERSAMTQSFANAIAGAKGSVVLSGATLGGFAYDDGLRKNGVFTAAVLDGLRGEAAAGREGWITARTLADFVQERVADWVRRNRREDATKSLGIARQIEATADTMPLAPHPESVREWQRYFARRAAAIARIRENKGQIINGEIWDEIIARLPESGANVEADRLLEEIEVLDGSEQSQRRLRDFIQELRSQATTTVQSPPSRNIVQRVIGGSRLDWLRAGLVAAVTLAGSFAIWKEVLPASSASSSQHPANFVSSDTGATTLSSSAGPAVKPFKISSIYLGTDQNIFGPKSTFRTDVKTIYAFVMSEGAAPNVSLHARWTFGDMGQVVKEVDMNISPKGPTVTEFHIFKETPWPIGRYHVEISADGASAGTKDFEITN
jgi:hypothetical protein